MKPDFTPSPTSVSGNPLLVASVVDLLEQVERLPAGATGALVFGDEGVILVEDKQICWAVARGMQPRLSDLLCGQRQPPLSHARLEQLCRSCRELGTPLGQALVEQGLLSTAELRAALERHTCEALVRIAQHTRGEPARFESHRRDGYHADFLFGPVELLAAFSGSRRGLLAAEAHVELKRRLPPDAYGISFMRELDGVPVLLAVRPGWSLTVSAALAITRWVLQALDDASRVDAACTALSGVWCEKTSFVAWRAGSLHYAALCASRPASARLLSSLVAQRRPPTEVT
ncbi:MAG: hypothetical protein ABW352_10880 [Polyangiales bacterium]